MEQVDSANSKGDEDESQSIALSQTKLDFLKQIPRDELVQAGFGDLNLGSDTDEDEFLSQTSVNDSDYQVLVQDDFVDVMNKNFHRSSPQQSSSVDGSSMKNSLKSLGCDLDIQVPKYSPNNCYNQQYYQMFLNNQTILENIDLVDQENYENRMQILRIKDFYDREIQRLANERYKHGVKIRKVTRRKRNVELDKRYCCPYAECERQYNTDCALSNHIMLKHNGGNKTDREKLAQALIHCSLIGQKLPDVLKWNLAPGIITKVAEQMEADDNKTVPQKILNLLEKKVLDNNRREIEAIKERVIQQKRNDQDQTTG